MQVMELYRQNIRPRDIMTEDAFNNAEIVDMALGCSTNTMLHLPAIAHECGIDIDLAHVNELSTPVRPTCVTWPPQAPPLWRIWSGLAACMRS